jgi:large exoprotein involved in heme utilization and adhesion
LNSKLHYFRLSLISIDDIVSIEGPSGLFNQVGSGAIGQGGDISITSGSLSLNNGALINASTYGQGAAGNVTIRARDAVSIDGVDRTGRFNTGIYSRVTPEAIGRGGDIRITTGKLSLTNGGYIDASTYGQGAAGNITIRARDAVSVDGEGSNGFGSSVLSVLYSGAVGRGGDIAITADSISFTNGGSVAGATLGQGNAGDLTLIARDAIVFDGITKSTLQTSGAGSIVDAGAIGRGGDVYITTGTLSIANGAAVSASTLGEGNAGTVTVTARDAVFIDGIDSTGESSGIFSRVGSGAAGQAGSIRITTDNLSLTNGGIVIASTLGQGDAGNITIRARGAVSFDGVGGDGDPSGAFSSVGSDAIGQGGNIRINANRLSLTNGAQVNAETKGQGRAGDITFNTPRLTVAGNAQVLAQTSSTGNGGSIVVNAPTSVNLRRTNNLSPVLSVETSGAGRAGDITINTPRLTLAQQARITATATATATTRQGSGSITLNASDLDLAGVVGVFAETQGQAPAGTLRLQPYKNHPDLDITLTPKSQISASTSGSGNGGDLIVIAPDAITITGPGRLAVTTRSTGNAGDIRFTTQQLNLEDGVRVSASTSSTGQAGKVDIRADTFSLSDGARVSTNTSSQGAAGDINVNADDQLSLSGRGTGLFASTAAGSTGNGGSISIDPQLVQVEDGARIAVNSQGRGKGGNIQMQANQVLLNQGSAITAETASTQGGNITLQVPDLLLLRRDSSISTSAGTAEAGGNGGNISFNGRFLVANPSENNDISANAFLGRGGSVTVNADSVFGTEARAQPTDQSDITASSARGVAGVVTIKILDVDPNRGLVQLPVELADASRLIAQTCPTGNAAKQPNQFVVSGRGGLPPSVSEAINPDAIAVELVNADAEEGPASPLQTHQAPLPQPSAEPSAAIVEAEGMQVAADGNVALVAATPRAPMAPLLNRLIPCQ